MLTLFTIPTPFLGHIGTIQRNAIGSWIRLRPKPEIVLFGDEPGTAGVAEQYGVRHVPAVRRNELGTPLVNDVFAQASRLGAHDVQCYINADIILLADFMEAIGRVAACRTSFLVVGRRWDLDQAEPLDFHEGWEEQLTRRAHASGSLHGPTGIDYFAFRRGLWAEIPPFAIGRTIWDNWLLYHGRARGAALIDGTDAITAIHQNHDYGNFGDADRLWKGPEAQRNLKLAGGYGNAFTLSDSSWRLSRHRLLPAVANYHRRLYAFPLRLVLRWLFRRRSPAA